MNGLLSKDFNYEGESHEKTMRKVNRWIESMRRNGEDINIINAETIVRGEYCSGLGIRIYYFGSVDLADLSLPLKDRLEKMEQPNEK